MNTYVKSGIIFIVGAAVGAVSTKLFLDKKYKEAIEEEIELMHVASGETVISERTLTPEEVAKLNIVPENTQSQLDEKLPDDIFEDADDAFFDYTQFDCHPDQNPEELELGYHLDHMYEYEEPIEHEKPYLIPEDEFGDTDYEQFYYIMYADGVVADDMDKEVRDVDGMFGKENLTHFGDKYLYPTQTDLIYIRDDKMKWEFEIALDPRKFDTEKYPNSPYRLEE